MAESSRPLTDVLAKIEPAALRQMLEDAHLPTLILTLVQLTGNLGLIRGDVRPQVDFMSSDDGLTDDQRTAIRDQALAILLAYRDNPKAAFSPSDVELKEMLEFLVGEAVTGDYVEFLSSELALHGEDPYAQPLMQSVPESVRSEYKVVVIGAGMSGLLSAIRLQEAGIEFEIIEKNPDVGGTWFENTYPGCRVDSANHVYSYSFRPKDWPQHFSNQEILRQYFADTADEYKLRDRIQFSTEVTKARFDERSQQWQLTCQSESGSQTIVADAVISCVGQLNRPRMPGIQGEDLFAGPAFHSARWEHEHDLTGKRIGVIGTGASAFQFVPHIAEQAESVTIFQRTAPWIVPNPDYFQDVPEGTHFCLNNIPFYDKWFRFSTFWRSAEGLLQAVQADEGWNQPEESVGENNQLLREILIANLQEHLGDKPELLARCTPDYPPGAKRMLIDDGRYLQTLRRDNVNLLDSGISEVTPTGLVAADGTAHEFDVLIFGTGFSASSFIMPMQVFGLEGKELQEVWNGEARAYKGVCMPGFPNFFVTYGPNTNIVVNGSIIFFSECEVRYILGCLALSMAEGGKPLSVRQDIHDRYNEWIDDGNSRMSWGQSDVNTWYKNARGHITQNWPFTMREFWEQTRQPELSEYDVIGSGETTA